MESNGRSNVLIVYGSTTGNTEGVAEAIGKQLSAAGHEVTVLDAASADADGLCDGHDAVLFGCSAWGTDEVELQPDFDALFESFDNINARGRKVACFATGGSSFEHFCGSVDVIEARLVELGAVLMQEGLKIDGDLQSGEADVEEWTSRLAEQL